MSLLLLRLSLLFASQSDILLIPNSNYACDPKAYIWQPRLSALPPGSLILDVASKFFLQLQDLSVKSHSSFPHSIIMNNSQFRKLVLDTPARQAGVTETSSTLGATPRRDGATSSALGSRMRSNIPMTP